MKTYTGKSVDEVLKSICDDRGCQISDIEYNVIEEKKGLLGIGSNVTISAFTSQDVKDFIFDYLGLYFTEMNQSVAIEIIVGKQKDFDNEVCYKVILDAENNAVIIGKNGQTLRSISFVVKAAVFNTFKKKINVTIDVNHYKETRYKKVRAMAKRIAREVSTTHVDVELDPMPSDERKVIHQFLQNFRNIETTSIGEGPKRHLVIKYAPNKETTKTDTE